MQNPKLQIASILGIGAISHEVQTLTRPRLTRKKNWRIISLWRVLRASNIRYFFLTQNQIAIDPLPFKRDGFVVSIQKIPVPGAAFTIDYYSVKNINTGTELSLNCSNGISLMKKLIRFSFLLPDEIDLHALEQKYEPFQYCPVCGERCRLSDYTCELCGAKLSKR